MLDIQATTPRLLQPRADTMRRKKRRRPESSKHDALLPNSTSMKKKNVEAIPAAMAWGSDRPVRTLEGIHDGTAIATAGLVDMDALSTEQRHVPRERRISASAIPGDGAPSELEEVEIPNPIPDSVVFRLYSSDPLDMIDLSVWQHQLSRTTAEDLLSRNPTFSKLTLRGVRREASHLRQLVARHFGSVVKEIDVSYSSVIDVTWFATLAGECPSITRITAAQCPRVTDAAVRVLARKKGARLSALRIPGCENVTDDGIEILAKNCIYLRSLDLSGCPNVRDRSVFAMGALHGLEEVALDGCCEVTDEAARHLFTSATNLTSLSIKGCSSLTEKGLSYMHETVVPWGMRRHYNCAELATFRIGSNTYVSDKFIMVLTAVCPRLRILEVEACPLIGGDEAMGKVGGLGELADLRLDSLQRVSDQGIRQFFSDQPKRLLTHLSLTGCTKVTDVSLKCIAKNARSLRQLRLDRNVSVTDRGLGYLSKGLTSLTVLQATHLGMVSDEGVRLIGRRCLRLTDLDVSYCMRFSGTSFPALRRLRGLETLGLSGCRDIFAGGGHGGGGDDKCHSNNDEQERATSALKSATDFQALRHLKLADHPDLRDGAMCAVIEQNRSALATLDLSRCSRITTGGLTRAIKALSALRRLDLTGCERVSAGNIESLAQQAALNLRLSCATVAVDGFDGLTCCGNAADCRAREGVAHLARTENLKATIVQHAFRRYRIKNKEQQKAAREQDVIIRAAMIVQVSRIRSRNLQSYQSSVPR